MCQTKKEEKYFNPDECYILTTKKGHIKGWLINFEVNDLIIKNYIFDSKHQTLVFKRN